MYYLTENNHPVKCNSPANDWIAISESEYNELSSQINTEFERIKKLKEAEAEPLAEQERRIHEKLREIAIRELEKNNG